MAQRINIYLTDEEKEYLQKKRNKYKVSLSTIADKLSKITIYAFIHGADKPTQDKLYNEKLYENKGSRTSIKPKHENTEKDLIKELVKNKIIFYTNVLKIYANKDIAKYVNKDYVDYYYQEIDKELNKCKEQYWDYNNFIRNSRRNLKENKEYYKKAIEQMEESEKKNNA